MRRREGARGRLAAFCDKRRFRDIDQAKNALLSIRYHYGQEPIGRFPIRYYDCPNCFGWHLTSQSFPYWLDAS